MLALADEFFNGIKVSKIKDLYAIKQININKNAELIKIVMTGYYKNLEVYSTTFYDKEDEISIEVYFNSDYDNIHHDLYYRKFQKSEFDKKDVFNKLVSLFDITNRRKLIF